MVFKSLHPDIDIPPHLTTYQYLLTSSYSPLNKFPPSEIAGFTNVLTNDRISYNALPELATHLSTALQVHHGLSSSDTVSLFSSNSIYYPLALLACSRVGAIVSGASPAYNVEEMTYALKTARAKFIFTMPGESLNVAVKAAEKAGVKRERIFLLEGKEVGFLGVGDLIEEGRKKGKEGQVGEYIIETEKGQTNGDLCGFLSFSSGTTGLPKAVMISHRNVIAQMLQIQPLTPADHKKVLAILPAFHITGLVHILHLPILLNAEVYMLPSFTMSGMLDAVVKHRIPELLVVPPILIRLVRDPIVEGYDLSFVKRFSSGAAPISTEILTLLSQKFPQSGFKQGYGMTESCSCITAHPLNVYSYDYSSYVGTICASTSVKIMRENENEDGGFKEMGVGERGELWARGPQIVMGYLGNEAATRGTFVDDGEGKGKWLRTGDEAMVDGNGWVRITERIKELVKVKGVGVAPAEIEDCLLGCGEVEDCAVGGVQDRERGEVVKAWVVWAGHNEDAASLKSGEVKREGESVIEEGKWKGNTIAALKIIQWVKERKSRSKWVREVEFVREIPKSASGKILRRVLRANGGDGGSVKERGLVYRDKELLAKL